MKQIVNVIHRWSKLDNKGNILDEWSEVYTVESIAEFCRSIGHNDTSFLNRVKYFLRKDDRFVLHKPLIEGEDKTFTMEEYYVSKNRS